MATSKPRKSPGPIHSKKQWAFLMANFGNTGFTKRWAEEVVTKKGKKSGYRSLPLRVGKKK